MFLYRFVCNTALNKKKILIGGYNKEGKQKEKGLSNHITMYFTLKCIVTRHRIYSPTIYSDAFTIKKNIIFCDVYGALKNWQ